MASPTPRARRVTGVSDPTAAFFEKLGSRGHEPLLRKATGSARFDVVGGGRTERWLVTNHKGDIGVSRKHAAADCVLRGDRACFDRIVTGKQNFMAAVLRGELDVSGDPRLLVLIQRLFPRPSRRRRRQPSVAARRQT